MVRRQGSVERIRVSAVAPWMSTLSARRVSRERQTVFDMLYGMIFRNHWWTQAIRLATYRGGDARRWELSAGIGIRGSCSWSDRPRRGEEEDTAIPPWVLEPLSLRRPCFTSDLMSSRTACTTSAPSILRKNFRPLTVLWKCECSILPCPVLVSLDQATSRSWSGSPDASIH